MPIVICLEVSSMGEHIRFVEFVLTLMGSFRLVMTSAGLLMRLEESLKTMR